jgi:hypothetical protein
MKGFIHSVCNSTGSTGEKPYALFTYGLMRQMLCSQQQIMPEKQSPMPSKQLPRHSPMSPKQPPKQSQQSPQPPPQQLPMSVNMSPTPLTTASIGTFPPVAAMSPKASAAVAPPAVW